MEQLRGHKIKLKNNKWVYSDTEQPTVEGFPKRPCGKCGQKRTKKGHDACLGTLPGVMNACCGHGDTESAYVQFLDGFSIGGKDAVAVLNILKKYRR